MPSKPINSSPTTSAPLQTIAAYHLSSDKSTGESTGSQDINARFPIGSVTKTLTATLAARLSEQGLVDWDLPIAGSSGSNGPLTLRSLLNHTAATPFELSPSHWVAAPLTTLELQNAFEAPPSMPLPPGTWHYSNLGYGLAAYVLEQALSTPYCDLLDEYILGPLEMTETSYPRDDEGQRILGAAGPAGDLWSTLADLMALARALEGSGAIVTPEMLALMVEGTPADYAGASLGAGMRLHRVGHHRLLVSSGTISDRTTMLVSWPRRGASVLVAKAGYSHDALRESAVARWRRDDTLVRTWWWDGQEVAELRCGDDVDLVIRETTWPFPLFSGRSGGSTYIGVDWRGHALRLRSTESTLAGPGMVLYADAAGSAFAPGVPT